MSGTNLPSDQFPQINTDILFSIPTSQPTCSSIVASSISSPTVDSFLEPYKLVTSGNDTTKISHDLKRNISNFLTSLTNPSADKFQTITTKENYNEIDSYLTSVETRIPLLNFVNSCLSESLTPDTSALTRQKEVTEESKLRLESIKNPEQKVSYYEGWFPLFRPMSEPALFGIFAAGALLLLLSLGILLRLTGIEFQITLPQTVLFAGAGAGAGYGEGGLSTKNLVYIGIGLGIGLALGIYGYRQGWYNKIVGKKE